MQASRWIIRFLLSALLITVSGCARLNVYQTDGALSLDGLSRPVTVSRDGKGMPYIRAENLEDAFMALGFASAQDRLFQMELLKRVALGRICEVVGKRGLPHDKRMRTVEIGRTARRHAKILTPDVRRHFENFAKGVNAYIRTRPQTRPLEFSLAGVAPEPWRIEDSLAILYFMSWTSSGNFRAEITAKHLVDKLGEDAARSLFPLNVNPDDPAAAKIDAGPSPDLDGRHPSVRPYYGPTADDDFFPLRIGSNNWAVSPARTKSGYPIVASDPHLVSRILPGPWYPCGIITPGFRAVGVMVPGVPGMVVFRNDRVAAGVTNAYGDVQDLFIEKIDPEFPDHYLENGRSVPFETHVETIRILDASETNGFREEKLTIRRTRRGPVVSDVYPVSGPDEDPGTVYSLRWGPAEFQDPDLSLGRIMFARSAGEISGLLKKAAVVCLNVVYADADGAIGWKTTGKIPIRKKGDGLLPQPGFDGADNWDGWISPEWMPGDTDPEKGWLGTCNHYTLPHGFPYPYTTMAAPSFRYRRLKELLDPAYTTTVQDHSAFQTDTYNLLAEEVAPVMAAALASRPETLPLARILEKWDFDDAPEAAGPVVFQAVYRRFAIETFEDELGPELTRTYLRHFYFWSERLLSMVRAGESPWFDDRRTTKTTETMEDIFIRAGIAARRELAERMGADPEGWSWGKIHRMIFVSPLSPGGAAKEILGGGAYPAGGSGETLLRGAYRFHEPFDVYLSDSLRMVADLGDPDKVAAILPGGVTGRVFNPHQSDQIPVFMHNGSMYWWFSDAAIEAHTLHTLTLRPE